ncbi:MAG: TonB-dependent receptor plug domain-containing protein [Pseudomonadota bacterium]
MPRHTLPLAIIVGTMLTPICVVAEEEQITEEIIVYGTKVQRSLKDTPNSVALYSEENLEKRNITTLNEAVLRTPGVNLLDGGGGLTIRGVRYTGVSGNTPFNETLSVFVDGVRQSAESAATSPFYLFDTQQVEIYRGGQSTNRGAASIAGGVEIKTNDPVYYTEGGLEVGTKYSEENSSNGYKANAFYNMPLSDQWAMRVTASWDDFEGYLWNPFLDDYAAEEEFSSVRAKLLYTGTDESFTSSTTVSFKDFSEGQPWTDLETIPERSTSFDEIRDNEVVSIAQRFTKDFDGGHSIEANFTYAKSERDALTDRDGALPFQFSSTDNEDISQTAELKWIYDDGGNQSFLLGAYYDRKDIENSSAIAISRQFLALALAPQFGGDPVIAEGLLISFGVPEIVEFNTMSEGDRVNTAIFGEYERELTESISVRLGLRWDRESQDLSDVIIANATIPGLGGTTDEVSDDDDYSRLLPSVVFTWAVNDYNNLSFVYKQDYRTGGLRFDLNTGAINTWDPEYTNGIELAWRYSNPEAGWQTQLNVYYTEWEDQQVTVTRNPGDFGITENAGESVQYGLEAYAQYNANDLFDVYGSIAYNDTEFKEFDTGFGSQGDLSGREFLFSPDWTVTAGITFNFSDNLTMDLNANYQEDSWASLNYFRRANDDFLLVNANALYRNDNWHARLWVNNLFDEDYISWATDADPRTNNGIGNRRTIGLDVGFSF